MRKTIIAALIMGSAFTTAGCSRNYAAEGGLVGAAAGAGVAAATGGDVGTGAAIGGAVGAVGGSQVNKDRDRDCYRYDRDGNRYRTRDC